MNLRPPTPEDVPALAELMNRAAVDGLGRIDKAEVSSWFSNPGLDLATDGRVAERDGLAGYVDVGIQGERAWIDLRLPPPGDLEVGAALLEWAEERARAVPVVRAFAVHGGPAARALEARGYRAIRHAWDLEIELDGAREPKWPEGIAVRTFRPGDERAVHEAQLEAFR